MRNIATAIVLALVFAFSLPAAAPSGERPRPNFAAVEAHAYLLMDDTDMVSYGFVATPTTEPQTLIKFVQKNRGKAAEIILTPESARRIAEEAEPYILLAQRNRRFNENIEIDKNVGLSLEFRNRFRASIRTQAGTVSYEGDKAFTVLGALFDAENVAGSWVGDIFCRPTRVWRDGVHLPRPSYWAEGPANRPDAPPSRPETPANRSEVPLGASLDNAADQTVDEGFGIRDLVVVPPVGGGAISKITGTVFNNSGRDFNTALMKLRFYDEDGGELAVVTVVVRNFRNGDSQSFSTITDADLGDWKTYRIWLEGSV